MPTFFRGQAPDIYDSRVLDVFMNAVGLECTVKEHTHPSYIEGRVGEIFVYDQKVGVIGELHPEVLNNWEMKTPVVTLELDIEKIFKIIKP